MPRAVCSDRQRHPLLPLEGLQPTQPQPELNVNGKHPPAQPFCVVFTPNARNNLS